MIGETNINGGGGLNGKGALLKIKALTGSVITVSKGSYSKIIKTSQLDPDDNKWSYWFFQTTNFGIWTIIATLGDDTASDTVTVNATNEYDVVLTYCLWLYKEGNIYSSITGGYSKVYNSSGSGGSFVLEENSATVKGASGDNAAECGCTTVSDVDLTEISYLKIDVLRYSAGTTNYPGGYMAISKTAGFVAAANAAAFVKCNAVGVRVIDVSAFSGKYYIKVMGAAQSGTITFDKIWCEK